MKSIPGIKNRGGRPATGRGAPVLVRLHSDRMAALDAWIARQPDPKPSRPEAIRVALKDWLTGLGLLPVTTNSEKIAQLEDKIAGIPEHAGPSPAAAMATMKRAVAENELVKLKNARPPAKKAKAT